MCNPSQTKLILPQYFSENALPNSRESGLIQPHYHFTTKLSSKKHYKSWVKHPYSPISQQLFSNASYEGSFAYKSM
jgi:hypothetical protein